MKKAKKADSTAANPPPTVAPGVSRRLRNELHWKRREYVLLRDLLACMYCLCVATTVDHVLPLSQGGTNDVRNLVACCRKCNRLKGSGPVDGPLIARRIRESTASEKYARRLALTHLVLRMLCAG